MTFEELKAQGWKHYASDWDGEWWHHPDYDDDGWVSFESACLICEMWELRKELADAEKCIDECWDAIGNRSLSLETLPKAIRRLLR